MVEAFTIFVAVLAVACALIAGRHSLVTRDMVRRLDRVVEKHLKGEV